MRITPTPPITARHLFFASRFCYCFRFAMTEQDTEQQEEIRDAAHPFDTELEIAEGGPAGDDDESAEADDEPAVEEVLSVDPDDEPEADVEVLAAEVDEGASADEEPGQAESELAEDEPDPDAPARSTVEVMAIAEAIIFVADEPITSKMLGDIIGEDKETVQAAVEELQ